MISQADIIKTLVNKNCTDESVMSTALSPECTPPKLLEKLTEAERFDLALDVSMKLGLDVIPLWRTWAMRCLQNRNFQGAREKFRPCFRRVRLPGGRTSAPQSRLLTDILAELLKMDETQLPLSEEVELIKQGTQIYDSIEPPASIFAKPKLFAECVYYLREYGSLEDRIRFYIKNSLWEEAVHVLLNKSDQINAEKFFLTEVLPHSTSTGHLSDLITTILKSDPDVVLSAKYFKAIYNFCSRNRRYHLLYYVQLAIGDLIAAANTQISFFFLKDPVRNYRELNSRIPSLDNARKNYDDYLDQMSNQRKSERNSTIITSSLITSMSKNEVGKRKRMIQQQIDITRNFAINEVTGCINGIEIGNDNSCKVTTAITTSGNNSMMNDSPVTLFDKSERRKTFLAALVLIYYDLSCSTYFSKSGLELANQIISDQGLDKKKVFKTAMRIVIEDETCDILKNASLLLERIKDDYCASNPKSATNSATQTNLGAKRVQNGDVESSGSQSEESKPDDAEPKVTESTQSSPNRRPPVIDGARALCDEVIRDSIGSCREADYKMELAKLLSGEAKIELYIEHGKLSNAQRLACNMNRPDYVSSIIEEAAKLNQNHVKTVCQLWLAKHETRNFIR